jgi:cyclic pyranopterin phosphate synthase
MTRSNGIVPSLVDRFGRVVRSLRISLTDRCNYRCLYCLPAVLPTLSSSRKDLMTFEEIVFIARIASEMGIRRFRLTGGEPLLRKGIEGLIAMLSREVTPEDLSLTTNGYLLAEKARGLKEAGLMRITVSVDSRDGSVYRSMTRAGEIERVWKGVEEAIAVGFQEVKINVVVLKGINDQEVEGWVAWTRENPVIVRFLELMPVGEGERLFREGRYANLVEIRESLKERYGLEPASPPVPGSGPARYYHLPRGKGLVGFITPISEPYCDRCSRFRLSVRGILCPCLAYELGVDLKEPARAQDEKGVREGFLRAVALKPWGHRWHEGEGTSRSMAQIGG